MSAKEIDLGNGREGYIHFEEGGVGVLETLITGGAALVMEKTMDAATGSDDHGWYCTITEKETDIKVCCWGISKNEAQERTMRAIHEKVDEYLSKRRRIEEERYQQRVAEHERLLRQSRSTTYQPSSGSESSDGEIEGCLVKAVIYLVLIFLAIWFVFSVAIPLILINTAIITLIAAFVKPKWNKLLLWVAIVTGALVVVDYNAGWLSGALIENISMSLPALRVFMYINLIAGLIAAYFVIRDYLDERYPKEVKSEEISTRNFIVFIGLTVLGALVIFGQSYLDRKTSEDIPFSYEKSAYNSGTSNNSANYQSNSSDGTSLNQAAFVKTKEGSNLRLRAYPSLDAEIITLIPDQSPVEILEYDDEMQMVNEEMGKWCKIEYKGQIGWAWGGFIYKR